MLKEAQIADGSAGAGPRGDPFHEFSQPIELVGMHLLADGECPAPYTPYEVPDESPAIPGWRGRPAPLSQCFFIHFTASHGKAQHIVDQMTTGQAIAIVSTFDDLARIPGGVASLVRRWESPVVQASRSGRPTMK
ncbi:hypothetical protein [Streptomyces glaucescens]|jgi:hypothetical protein|uniref:hypothetical protein n=1 Tax=Streptomyces glaucescens TaxID=1907 RepID=UPI00117E9894|nr:hypothetical protein [Streptomyces glaucescens]